MNELKTFSVKLPLKFSPYLLLLFVFFPSASALAQKDVIYKWPPIVKLSEESLQISTVAGTPITQSISVSNVGDTLLVGTLSLGVGSPFSLGNTSFAIEPGQDQTIDISFAPTEPGEFNDTLWVASNDLFKPLVSLPISGLSTTRTPVLEISPAQLDFGTVQLGQTGQMTLSIFNRGDEALQGTLRVRDGLYFSLNTPNFEIGPHSQLEVPIEFTPDRIAAFEDQLQLTSNDPEQTNLELALLGLVHSPIAALGSTQIEFGPVLVGNSQSARFFLINLGTAPLEAQLSSTNPDFVLGNSAIIVPNGDSLAVDLVFTPSSLGLRSGQVSLTTNDPLNTQLTLGLLGSGSGAEISLSRNQIDFGPIGRGTTSSETLTVENRGNRSLEVTLAFEESSGEFLLSETNFSLEPGGAKTVSAVFFPASAGSFSTNLYIRSNDPLTGEIIVPLSGEGIVPTAEIFTPESSIDFGFITLGNRLELPLTIHNRGDSPLLGQFELVGAGPFSLTQTQINLAPGDSLSTRVAFEPTAVGSYTATISLLTNDPESPNIPVALSGGVTSQKPILSLSTAQFDFGALDLNSQRITSIILSNRGDLPLTGQLRLGQGEPFIISRTDFNILPQEFSTVDISFTPTSEATFADTLWLESNDEDTPLVGVPLQGRGIQRRPEIVLDTTPISFNRLEVGQQQTQTLSWRNDGEIPLDGLLQLRAGQVFGISLADFTIQPGSVIDLELSFTPNSIGAFTDNLVIQTNDPNNRRIEIALSGSARADGAPTSIVAQGLEDLPLSLELTPFLNPIITDRLIPGVAWQLAGPPPPNVAAALNSTNNTLTLTPTANFNGPVSIALVAQFEDPSAADLNWSENLTAQIDFLPVAELVPTDLFLEQGQSATLDLSTWILDPPPSGQDLSWTIDQGPSSVSWSLNGDQLSLSADYSYVGADSFNLNLSYASPTADSARVSTLVSIEITPAPALITNAPLLLPPLLEDYADTLSLAAYSSVAAIWTVDPNSQVDTEILADGHTLVRKPQSDIYGPQTVWSTAASGEDRRESAAANFEILPVVDLNLPLSLSPVLVPLDQNRHIELSSFIEDQSSFAPEQRYPVGYRFLNEPILFSGSIDPTSGRLELSPGEELGDELVFIEIYNRDNNHPGYVDIDSLVVRIEPISTPPDSIAIDDPDGSTPPDSVAIDDPDGSTPPDSVAIDDPDGSTPPDGVPTENPDGSSPDLPGGDDPGETFAIQLIGPLNNAKVDSTDLAFRWLPTEGSSLDYSVEVSQDSSFSSGVVAWPADPPQLRHISHLLEMNKQYWWRVRAQNDDGQLSSTIESFYVGRPPQAFTLLDPSPSQIVRSRLPTFSWTNSPDPDNRLVEFRLEVSKEPEFLNPIAYDLPRDISFGQGLSESDQAFEWALWSTADTLEFTLPDSALFNETTEGEFFWRVTATNPDEFSYTPPASSFRMSLFMVEAPADSTLGLTPFRWTRYLPDDDIGPGAPLDYQLTLRALPVIGDTTLVISPPVDPDQQQIQYILRDPRVLNAINQIPQSRSIWVEWDLQATIDDLSISAGPPRYFTVAPVDTTQGVSLLWPPTDAVVALDSLAFRWEVRPEPRTIYVLDVKLLDQDKAFEDSMSLHLSSTTIDVNDPFLKAFIQPNQNYSWQVQAITGDTVYTTPLPWNFTVGQRPSPFALVSPGQNGVVDQGLPELTWQRSIDLDGHPLNYRLEVASDSNFTDIRDQRLLSGDLPDWDPNDQELTMAVADTLENGTYFWRVVAIDPSGLERPSDQVGQFWVNVFTVLGPEDGYFSHGRMPMFAWTRYLPSDRAYDPAIDLTQTYRLLIDVPSDFEPPRQLASPSQADPQSPPIFAAQTGQLQFDLVFNLDQPASFHFSDPLLEERMALAEGAFTWQLFALTDTEPVAAGKPRQFFLAEEPLIRFVPVPNPFPISRETAAFHFSLAKEAAAVEIVVYDMMGNPLRKLRDNSVFAPQQDHILSWDGINAHGEPLGTGVYATEFFVRWAEGGMSRTFTKLAVVP